MPHKNIQLPYLLILFLFSGASALVYEVIWVRQLILVFGNTVHASSVVLTAYMAGLALGSWYFGKWIDRNAHRVPGLKAYGWMELGIGVFSVLLPLYLKVLLPGFRMVYQSNMPPWLALTLKFLAAFLYLLVPTALMGGTLPVLSRALSGSQEKIQKNLSYLYSTNTLGAVLGVLAAGFVMLPRLGMVGSYLTALGVNVALGLFALKWSAGAELPPQEEGKEKATKTPFRMNFFLAAFFLTGFISLGLEVVWTRILLLVFGSTVYSFSTMLAVFLAGIALGSWAFGKLIHRMKSPGNWLVFLLSGLVVWLVFGHLMVNQLPHMFLSFLLTVGSSWSAFLGGKVLLSFLILFPMAFFFGAMFPVVARIELRSSENLGTSVGRIYAFNTVGAILGSAAAGFVLIPLMGTEISLFFLAGILVLFLLVFLFSSHGPGVKGKAAVLLVIAGSVFVLGTSGRWDKKLLSAGVYFRPGVYVDKQQNIVLEEKLRQYELLEYIEGLTETASVVQTPRDRMFLVDGKVEATDNLIDMRLQRLMGHLPMLFAKKRASAVNIGLGCGVTLGALTPHSGLETLEIIEIEKEITKTARLFADNNHQVMDDPRLKITIQDGRNHMLLTDRTYDVITSDPFEPLVGGAATLYSYDHFLAAGKRLNPGGIMCQYLPLYQLAPKDFWSIAKTFSEAFPHAVIFYTGIDSVMLGSFDPINIEFDELKARMEEPAVKASLERVGLEDPYRLLATFMFDLKNPPAYFADLPINRDRKPHIEFNAPKSHLDHTTPTNIEGFLEYMNPEEIPVTFKNKEEKEKYLAFVSNHRDLMQGTVYSDTNLLGDAHKVLSAVLEFDPEDKMAKHTMTITLNKLGQEYIARGEFENARAAFGQAVPIAEQPALPLIGQATAEFQLGLFGEAYVHLGQAAGSNPRLPETFLRMGQIDLLRGNLKGALGNLEQAFKRDPGWGEVILAMGETYVRLGEGTNALALYEGLSKKKMAAIDLFFYGEASRQSGLPDQAISLYKQSLKKDPAANGPRLQLIRILLLTGNKGEAKTQYQLLLTQVGAPELNRLIMDSGLEPLLKENGILANGKN